MLGKKYSGKVKPRPISGIGRKLTPEGSGFTNYLERKEKMKSYRNAIAATVLAFVFSTSTFAEGLIHTDRTPPPPPPTQEEGVLRTDEAPPEPEEDTLTEIVLNLLQTLILLP